MTSVSVEPGTRARRHSAATPEPLPISSTCSPGFAGTAAATAVGSTNEWCAVVASYTNNGTRQIWAKPVGGSIVTDGSVSGTPVTTNTTLDWMFAGQASGNNGGQFAGKLAELAVWTSILSQSDREAFLGGTAADTISASTLKGYWLKTGQSDRTNNVAGETWTLSSDTSGGSSVAVYSTDHPTITSATTKYLKLGVAPGTNPENKIYMKWAP